MGQSGLWNFNTKSAMIFMIGPINFAFTMEIGSPRAKATANKFAQLSKSCLRRWTKVRTYSMVEKK